LTGEDVSLDNQSAFRRDTTAIPQTKQSEYLASKRRGTSTTALVD